MSLAERCSKIELILSDVDGVMTDGGIHMLDDGRQMVTFHIRDGMGVRLWREAGKRFGIVTRPQPGGDPPPGGRSVARHCASWASTTSCRRSMRSRPI